MNLFKDDIIADRNSIYNIVASTFIKQIKLNEHEKKVVVMKLTPHHIGNLDIQAVVGKLVSQFTNEVSKQKLLNDFFPLLLGYKGNIKFVGEDRF